MPALRVASYPASSRRNPYLQLFYDALKSHDIELAGELHCSLAWLGRNAQELDALHFHWPEGLWRGRRRGRAERLVAACTARRLRGVHRLLRFLGAARRQGLMRIWTVHNEHHHEGALFVDRMGYLVLGRRVDLLVCHSRSAADAVSREHGARVPTLVIPHGSYEGAYPPPRPRVDALASLGLDAGLPLVCCVGLLRDYKGLDTACEAALRLAGRVQLVIAGEPYGRFDVGPLARACSANESTRLIPRRLEPQEFSDLVAASEAVILPYRRAASSGVLLAAWTLGTGVVACDLPLFREMLESAPLAGQLATARDSAHFARQIEQYLAIPAERRRAAAKAAAARNSFPNVVAPFAEAVHEWHRQHGQSHPFRASSAL